MKTKPKKKKPGGAKARPVKAGVWIALSKQRPRRRDWPAMGGSWRTNFGDTESHWSVSSVFDSPRSDGTFPWDDDRTHWMKMPTPPPEGQL